MKPDTRLAVVEDHAEFRRALVHALNTHPRWRVVSECADAPQALREIPRTRPHLVLLDLLLAGADGIDLIPLLRGKLSKTPIVMLTVVDNPDHIIRACEAGASGYILKGGLTSELLAGVEDALEGGATMSPVVARRLVDWFQRQPAGAAPRRHRCLTEREWEILRLAARGRQSGEISMTLGIALNTVKNHFRNIYEKLEVHSLTEALVKLNAGRGLLDDR
jgi:two-component system NarL family response regulator